MSEQLTLHGWIKGTRPMKDHTALTIALPNTQLGRDSMGALAQYAIKEQEIFLMLKTANFTPDETELMEHLEVEPDMSRKTPSQRQYAMLFISWSLDNEGYEQFRPYYEARMENNFKRLQKEIELKKAKDI